MKRLVLLCLVPLMAGCFAWDLDEKPVPWMPDPEKKKPGIGQVIYYSSKQRAQPAPAVYHVGASAPAARARYVEPAPVFGHDGQPPLRTDAPPVRNPVPPPSDDRAAPAPPVPGGDSDLEDRLSRLESRLEELYQLILRSYESKKRR